MENMEKEMIVLKYNKDESALNIKLQSITAGVS